jgi:hypothetical protein
MLRRGRANSELATLGPPGALPSHEAVLMLYGPEPIHEGQAISDALRKLLTGAKA